jgi:cyclic pyranopterin phosphate synthase
MNFAPGALRVPRDVKQKSVDLAVSIASLSFFLTRDAGAGETRVRAPVHRTASVKVFMTTPRKQTSARRPAPRLSHVDADGSVRMVDVGGKRVTRREAVARGVITIAPDALALIRAGKIAKGDPLQAARVAGIMAAKRTADLIPLCHSLPLSHLDVELRELPNGYEIEACARTIAQTGVEMEALTAVAAAALTIYDMVKAVDKTMVIGEICLIKKTGGRSGTYHRRQATVDD